MQRFAVGVMCLVLAGCGGNEPLGPTSDQAAERFATWYRATARAGGYTVPVEYRQGNPSSEAAIEALIRKLCAIDIPETPPRPGHAPADTLENDPAFFGNPGFAAIAIINARLACGRLD